MTPAGKLDEIVSLLECSDGDPAVSRALTLARELRDNAVEVRTLDTGMCHHQWASDTFKTWCHKCGAVAGTSDTP